MVCTIDGDEESILGVRTARAICAAVTAALESAKTGRPIDVEELP